METSKKTSDPTEAREFYQIRIQPALKTEFMQNCYDLALNPSAVLRMLMADWNRSQKTASSRSRKAARPPAPRKP